MARAERARRKGRHARHADLRRFALFRARIRSGVGPMLMAAAFGAVVVGAVLGTEYLKAFGGTAEQAVVTRSTAHDAGSFSGCKGAPHSTLTLRSDHPPAGLPATFTSSGCDQSSYAVGEVVPVRRVHGRVVLDPPDVATVVGGVLLGAVVGPIFLGIGLVLRRLVAWPVRGLQLG